MVTHDMEQLSVRDLPFAYSSTAPELFNHLTYTFPSGCCTALTGASGRGKSTLLYLLGLMLRPRGGEVFLGEEAVSQASDHVRSRLRAQRFGFVFQNSELDPHRSLLDGVAEPGLYAGLQAGDARERAWSLLSRLGLETEAARKPVNISGGQAQRAAIARALLVDPDVILADEPTGNLDRRHAAIVLDALVEASRQGRSVIIATHDPYVMEQCDEAVEL